MKKAFTHEYFIIGRKQHNLGSPDTCLVLDDFLLPSCSSHLSLTSLSLPPGCVGGHGVRAPSPGGQSPAVALTPSRVPPQPGDEPRAGDLPAPDGCRRRWFPCHEVMYPSVPPSRVSPPSANAQPGGRRLGSCWRHRRLLLCCSCPRLPALSERERRSPRSSGRVSAATGL